MSKYGVFSGPYFPVFGLNKEIYSEKYGPEKTQYLHNFYAMLENDNDKPVYNNNNNIDNDNNMKGKQQLRYSFTYFYMANQ